MKFYFYSGMFYLDFDCLFSIVNLQRFLHFVIDIINNYWKQDFVLYNSGVTMKLII